MLRRTPLKRRGKATARTRRYQAYLRSPAWKKLRARILERDNFTCRMCGEAANQVHHLSYARFTRELEADLVSVCNDCHHTKEEPS